VILTIILLGLGNILAISASILYVKHEIIKHAELKQAEIEGRLYETVNEWVKPGENNTQSKLAGVLESVGVVVGSSAARTLMASLNADNSHIAKTANGLLASAEAAKNPIIGLLRGGRRGKGAGLEGLAELLLPMLQSKGNGTDTSSAVYTGRKHRE
jgi:hypothetical protein